MAQCVVIADDLTGANATASLLKKMSYKAYTVMNAKRIEPEVLDACDCLVYPTDSRGIAGEIAYDRVYEACGLFMNDDVKVYGKRIDSTLRGNLGPETDAMLDRLGDEYIAIVAPCSPTSGRVLIGGYMLVNGIPLHRTDAASDPKAPVHVSEAAVLFKEQSRYGVGSIFMADMMDGAAALAENIRKQIAEGKRILIADCVTQEDLDLIADAVIAAGIRFIAVDPGAFTATLARKLIPSKKVSGNSRILVVVGSVNPNATAQLEELWLTKETNRVMVRSEQFLKGDEARRAEIDRVIDEVCLHAGEYSVATVVGDGIFPENRIDFAPYMAEKNCDMDAVTELINEAFAEITDRIIEREPEFKGLYSSGGDITVAICRRFETAGLALKDEVLPLAAYGEFLKGKYEGLHIITKGGSQGGRDAICRCVNYLETKLLIS